MNSLQKPYLAMVVEDDIPSKTVLIMQLMQLGMKLIEASTLPGAISILKLQIPDIIFLDKILYTESGLDLLKIRQTDENLKKIRIIVTTGDKSSDSIVEAVTLGADGYLMKPIYLDRLTQELKRLGFKMNE